MGHRHKINTKEGRCAAKGVWEKVINLLGQCDQCIILDAPAGSGLLSEKIKKKGGTVIAADISTVRSKGSNSRESIQYRWRSVKYAINS